MELSGTLVPQFRVAVRLPPGIAVLGRRSKSVVPLPLPLPLPLRSVVRCSSCPIWENLSTSYQIFKGAEVHCTNSSQSSQQSLPTTSDGSRLPGLTFNQLQLTDKECSGVQKSSFGQFIARGALIDAEYWAAAWLRAEAQYESVSYMRHVDNYKRKYADQEFYAVKRRCSGRDGNSLNCSCIVTVKKEEPNVRRTVLNSVVGTLDLSIRQFLPGETFPGELKKYSAVLASHEAYDAHKYTYIANLCVSKFARRQGIASNMLYLATNLAASAGMKQLFVHVDAGNNPAQELYRKTGFKV
ncbi:hypothetical protein Syun_002727 [Stephania yunnanensis]|uniref:N-acetyltransferase domain-containing protein n=1 Tax=Stephania yunnanensis TaxID=152371 RepID=A0AAP0Q7E9_9MAGN